MTSIIIVTNSHWRICNTTNQPMGENTLIHHHVQQTASKTFHPFHSISSFRSEFPFLLHNSHARTHAPILKTLQQQHKNLNSSTPQQNMAVVYFINQLTQQLLREAQVHINGGGAPEVLPRHAQIGPGNHPRKFYCKCCDRQYWVQNAQGHFRAGRHSLNLVCLFSFYDYVLLLV